MIIQTTFDFDMMFSNARDAFAEEMTAMAEEGYDFAFTYSDNVAPSSAAGKFINKYPERCFNFGIAEQNQVAASAGIALSGQIVFAQVFGPFLPLRAADMIHTDVCYNDLPVRLIGTHSGVTAGGGPTHNNIADLALYRAIPNLTVIVPADAGQCIKAVRESIAYSGPMVIRIARGDEPNVYASQDYDFNIGKAIQIKDGDDISLIGTGSAVYWALMASKALEADGISARVIDMHTIKPLDTEAIKRCADETGGIITIEDHSIYGGLGSAVAEVLCEYGNGTKFARIGMPDEFSVLGDPSEIYHYYGLDQSSIAERAKKLCKLKR